MDEVSALFTCALTGLCKMVAERELLKDALEAVKYSGGTDNLETIEFAIKKSQMTIEEMVETISKYKGYARYKSALITALNTH